MGGGGMLNVCCLLYYFSSLSLLSSFQTEFMLFRHHYAHEKGSITAFFSYYKKLLVY
jgi:hypothetical protein